MDVRVDNVVPLYVYVEVVIGTSVTMIVAFVLAAVAFLFELVLTKTQYVTFTELLGPAEQIVVEPRIHEATPTLQFR